MSVQFNHEAKKKKAARIAQELNLLFPDPKIPLQHEDSYTLLIATLLSAQCTDKTVNRITPLLFACAKTPQTMRTVPVSHIQEIIRPCGLSKRKAEAIVRLSETLIEKHHGVVPACWASLEALPGVGHKTASVIMVQAFGVPAFPVDTHIHRCAARWGLSQGISVKQTELDLKQLFAPQFWGRIHLQMIYFARQYCPALRHIVSQCPICCWAAIE